MIECVLEEFLEEGGEKLERLESKFTVGEAADCRMEVLSHTSKLTCVR